MWTWSLNWAEITPTILIGACPMAPADVERIHREGGCAALLSVQHDDCLGYWGIDEAALRDRGRALGLRMQRRPMRDFDSDDQRLGLAAAVAALAEMQSAGHRTYVHCTAGLGRAPLTVWAYLSWIEGWDPQDAVALIKARRAGAVPSPEAFVGCRSDLLARYRTTAGTRPDPAANHAGSAPETEQETELAALRTLLVGDRPSG